MLRVLLVTRTQHATDVEVSREGGLFLFAPLTGGAQDWIDEHVGDDATWCGERLVVEHRYALELAEGMLSDGLRVS